MNGSLVGDLEDREVALGRRLEQRRGHLRMTETGAEAEAGEVVVGEQGDELALALGRVELHAGGEQQLAAGQPRVGSISSEMWTQRTGSSSPVSPASD